LIAMKVSLVLCLSLCFAIYVHSAPQLYAVVTTATWTETLMWVVQVDTTTGAFTNVTSTMVYGGGSATEDGISAFDAKNMIYYYTTDVVPPVITYVSINSKSDLGEIDLYMNAIFSLTVNPLTSELFVVGYDQHNDVIIVGVSYPEGSERLVLQLPSNLQTSSIGTFDATNNIFYLVSYNNSNFMLTGIDPKTGNILSIQPFPKCSPIYPQNIKFDGKDGMVYGGGIDVSTPHQLKYDLLEMNPKTGFCNSTLVPTSMGIVTAWSYDPVNRNLWYADAINGGFLLRAVNVDSGNQVVSLNTQWILENMEIDPNT